MIDHAKSTSNNKQKTLEKRTN